MFFSLPYKGQLNLSTSAIKVMAKTYGETRSADAAVRSALRKDVPSRLSVMLKGEDVSLDQQVIWAFGTTGSGTTEAAVSFAKENSSRGGKALFVTPRRILERLPPEETFYMGEGWNGDFPLEVARKGNYPFRVITVANVCRDAEKHATQFCAAISVALSSDADLVVLDDVLWHRYPEDLTRFISEARAAGKRLLVMSHEWRHVPEMAIKPADAILLMRSVSDQRTQDDLFSRMPWFSHEPPSHEEVLLFQPGDGFLISLVNFGRFTSHYSSGSRTSLPKPALKAVEILSRSSPHGTHLERLDAAAKACGYRSWHAAQGRK